MTKFPKSFGINVQGMVVIGHLLFLHNTPLFASSDAHSAAHAEVPTRNPDEVLTELKKGNERFVKGQAKQHDFPKRREELVSTQKPAAIILSCSDSRVPPEHVFDQGLGDIFPIRVAGNALGAAAVASIEYAIEHLGASLLVVMGHESCGGVKAAVATPPEKSAGSADLDTLVASIRPHFKPETVKKFSDGRQLASSDDKAFVQPVIENVDGVAKDLMARSAIVRKSVESGRLKISKGIYSLHTGGVKFW